MTISSVETLLNVYLKENRDHQKQRGGNKNEKVADEICEYIRGVVYKNCDISLQYMRLKFVVHFGVSLSNTTAIRGFKKFHYIFKKK